MVHLINKEKFELKNLLLADTHKTLKKNGFVEILTFIEFELNCKCYKLYF